MRNIIICFLFVFFIFLNDSVAQTITRIDTGAIVKDPGNNQGSSWADYDNDGYVDLLVTHSSAEGMNKPNLLYHNEGIPSFSKVTLGPIATDIIEIAGGSVSWGDYDNNGLPDLFTANAGGNNRLYHNDGNGNFHEVLYGALGGGNSDGCWADYDNDGYLDLFVANVSSYNSLYRNNGNGSFAKIDTGLIAHDSCSAISLSWGDFNNDGRPDVFWSTAHPYQISAPERNRLYVNQGNGFFTSIDSRAVVLSDSGWTPGASWGDYDNDGYLDLYVVNFQPPEAVNHLYHNNGNGTFTQITIDPPEASGACSIGSAWGDFDNDGYLDLFVTNDKNLAGRPTPSSRDNFFFHNNGDGTFSRITTGAIVKDGGHTCSVCDYDNDGFLDIMIPNGSLGAPYTTNYLYHNDGNGNHWVNIRCVGTVSNRSAIGTRLRAKAMINGKAVWQTREIAQMSGCHANSDPRVHFGFREATVIDSLTIRWPSGRVDTYTALAADNFYIATEGQNIVSDVFVKIYPEHLRIDRLYARKGMDSVLFTTTFFNADKHQFTSQLICANTDGTQRDSLKLYDDGLHGDSVANDGIYGTYIPPRSIEDYFFLNLSTLDQQISKYMTVPAGRFTTAGPLVVDSVWVAMTTGPEYWLKLRVRNRGTAFTVRGAKVIPRCDDPWVVSMYTSPLILPDLAPGAQAISGFFSIWPDTATFRGHFNLVFETAVAGWVYWTDATKIVTGIDEGSSMPQVFALEQNFPNPFNPSTTIKYGLPQRSHVILIVYNTLGQQVATLVNGDIDVGYHEVKFDGTNLSSGVYFYRIQAGSFVQTRKLLLIR